MELTFRTATPAERLYAYEQSTQIAGQCGSPGYLHCTLSQNELLVNFSEWKQNVPSLDTAEFTEASITFLICCVLMKIAVLF